MSVQVDILGKGHVRQATSFWLECMASQAGAHNTLSLLTPYHRNFRDREMQQPKSATFREGVVDAMRATQGAATDESPEADHPAYKYQVSAQLLCVSNVSASVEPKQAGIVQHHRLWSLMGEHASLDG